MNDIPHTQKIYSVYIGMEISCLTTGHVEFPIEFNTH